MILHQEIKFMRINQIKNLQKKLSPKKDLAVIIKIPTVPIQAIKKVL